MNVFKFFKELISLLLIIGGTLLGESLEELLAITLDIFFQLSVEFSAQNSLVLE